MPSSRRTRSIKLLIAILSASILGAAIFGHARFRARAQHVYAFEAQAAAEGAKDADIARGAHLAHTLGGCAKCHGGDLAGKVMSEDATMRLVAPNLTPGRGSAVRGYRARDWARAIVHGTRPRGTSLLVMPSPELSKLADADVAAITRYMQSLRPVDRELAGSRVSLVGRVVLGLADAPVFSAEGYDHQRSRAAPPEVGPTRVYGEYMLNMCRGCHGPALQGGIEIHPGAPPSADISQSVMRKWSWDGFQRALREGIGGDGRILDAAMPWQATKGLSGDELRALWLALRGE